MENKMIVAAKPVELSIYPVDQPSSHWAASKTWALVTSGALIGIMLGSATGLTLALTVAPREASAAVQTAQPTQAISATVQTPAVESQNSPAVTVPVAAVPVAARLALHSQTAHRRAIRKVAAHRRAAHLRAAKFVREASLTPSQSTASPVPAETASGSALPTRAQASAFYVEGSIRVVDYDPTSGTLESSDGTRFLVGAKINHSISMAWIDSPSSLHYRCGQDGSCVLNSAGLVLTGVRQI